MANVMGFWGSSAVSVARTPIRFVRTGTVIQNRSSTEHNVQPGEWQGIPVRLSTGPLAPKRRFASDITAPAESGQVLPRQVTHHHAAEAVTLHALHFLIGEQGVGYVVAGFLVEQGMVARHRGIVA